MYKCESYAAKLHQYVDLVEAYEDEDDQKREYMINNATEMANNIIECLKKDKPKDADCEAAAVTLKQYTIKYFTELG